MDYTAVYFAPVTHFYKQQVKDGVSRMSVVLLGFKAFTA